MAKRRKKADEEWKPSTSKSALDSFGAPLEVLSDAMAKPEHVSPKFKVVVGFINTPPPPPPLAVEYNALSICTYEFCLLLLLEGSSNNFHELKLVQFAYCIIQRVGRGL